jgi:hypothetical protein
MLGPSRDLNEFTDAEVLEECDPESLLNEIDRVNQERKAVKLDDAAIPEYLWEEHLLEGIPHQPWSDEEDMKKVRLLTGWLRRKMLAWWKRNVTISYVAWAKTKYCLVTKPAERDAVKWKDGWFEIDESGRKVWRKRRLEWSDDDGLHGYQKWWENRFLITHQGYEPAANAIQRAADSSWWS